MSTVIPLQIFPWPMDEARLGILKEAKAGLDTDVKVMPTRAVPGLHARVLSFAGKPPWVCDVAMASDPTSVDSVRGALDWVLNAPAGDTNGYMVLDYLTDVFGVGVREVEPDPCHCGRERRVVGGKFETDCPACMTAGCAIAGFCIAD